MSSLLLRRLHRLLISSRQVEGVTSCSSSPQQPLATWSERIRRWSSGNQTTKKQTGEVTTEPESSSSSAADGEEAQEGKAGGEAAEATEQKTETARDDIEVLLQEKDEMIKQFQDKYLRALAEVENIRQRSKKQVEEAKLYGIQGFSKDILEVADVLQKATLSVPEHALQEKDNPHLVSLYNGVKLTEAQLQKVLKKNGVDQINPLGQMFDPVYHEAMFEVEGDKPGTVAHVTLLGYILHGRTLRPARVGVVKQPDAQ